MISGKSFPNDVWTYAKQIRLFDRTDWWVYFGWIGMMLGLLGSICGFFIVGWYHGVTYPAYLWNLPIGTGIFVVAISFDTIGHRTTYKEALKTGESLVHHMTIFAGVTSCLLLCLAYQFRDLLTIPAYVMVFLSMMYSVIDEAMHWVRYARGDSDRVEMWSHFFIFVGHIIMMVTWCYWFYQGYPGVAETLPFI